MLVSVISVLRPMHAGPRVFDAMAPPCSLCDAAANALRRTGVQQRQAQAALTAVAVAAGALRAAARSTAVPLQAWVGAAGGDAAEALWDEVRDQARAHACMLRWDTSPCVAAPRHGAGWRGCATHPVHGTIILTPAWLW